MLGESHMDRVRGIATCEAIWMSLHVSNMLGGHSNWTGYPINKLGGHMDGVYIIVACLEAISMWLDAITT